MYAVTIEAVPSSALGILGVPLAIEFHLFVDEVVLARHIMHLKPGLGDCMIGIVELFSFRQMRDVAGVNHERRFCWKRFDLADCLLERADRIGIGGFIEADMAVADL